MSNEVDKAQAQGKVSKEDADAKKASIRNLFNRTLLNWEELVQKHDTYLKKYGVEFDENDQIEMKDENNSGKGEYDGADKIDHFRKLNPAIKLLLSTLPRTDNEGKKIITSVGGVQLIPTSQAWMTILNKVSDSLNVNDMLNKLQELAKTDSNYELLYQRLAKTDSSNNVNWDSLTKNTVNLIGAFNIAFNKQNPDVKIFNILSNGQVQVGESNFNTAARQTKEEFVNGIRGVLNNPKNPYFKYIDSEYAYVANKDAVKGLNIDNLDSKVKFLSSLGINFELSELRNLEVNDPFLLRKFENAVSGIKASMEARNKISTIGGKMLDIDGRLLTLSEIKAKIDNPEFSSTFFGVDGERKQTYTGTNPSSDLYKNLSVIKNYEDLKTHPEYSYLYTDSFCKHSVTLDAIFNIDEQTREGERKSSAESKLYLKPGVADGINDQEDGKKKSSARLSFRDRLIQEVNMNQEGWYYNLVAGDASREYMTYMGNHISLESVRRGFDDIHSIFRGYLIDEINLAREDRPVAKDRKGDDLRFMKSILGDKLTKDILKNTDSPEKIYEDNKSKIDNAVEKFIKDETAKFRKTLTDYNIISKSLSENMNNVKSLAFAPSGEISEQNLNLHLQSITANYIINNIEFHKILYSDPYQYSDELKRIKNFLSPRQALISGSAEMNATLNRVWNEGYKKGDIGYTDMTRDYFRSTTLEDVKGVIDLKDYGNWEETDGGGIISFKAHRNFSIRAGIWDSAKESQYKYDVAWEK
jgi:hypothetical protein